MPRAQTSRMQHRVALLGAVGILLCALSGCQQGSERILKLAFFDRAQVKAQGKLHERLVARYYQHQESADTLIAWPGGNSISNDEREALEMIWRIQVVDEATAYPEPAVVEATSNEEIWNRLNHRARLALIDELDWSIASPSPPAN